MHLALIITIIETRIDFELRIKLFQCFTPKLKAALKAH